jgi:hypothetical protein
MIFQRIYEAFRLREAKVGAYQFAKFVNSCLNNNKLKLDVVIDELFKASIGKVATDINSRIIPCRTDESNMQKRTDIPYPDTQDGIYEFACAVYHQYNTYFANNYTLPWDELLFVKTLTKAVCEHRGITYERQNKEGDIVTA